MLFVYFSERQRFIYLIIEDNWLRNCYISLLFSRNCTNFISMQISSIHYKLLIELSLSYPPPPLSLSCCLTLSSMCFVFIVCTVIQMLYSPYLKLKAGSSKIMWFEQWKLQKQMERGHRVLTPLSLSAATAGRNNVKKVITPSSPLG